MPEIITRDLAIAMGLRFYFDGRLCRKGHLSWRYCSGHTCVECSRERYELVLKKSRAEVSNEPRVSHVVRMENDPDYYREYLEKRRQYGRRQTLLARAAKELLGETK